MHRPSLPSFVLLAALAVSACAADWHASLYLGRHGYWRRRVPVTVHNDGSTDIAGVPVAIRVGTGDGQADLAGARIESVRVCNGAGTEMLYALVDSDSERVTRGTVQPDSALILPAECAARGTARYYVYFDNPEAWGVPDFLAGALPGEMNGAFEKGNAQLPAGWTTKDTDDKHTIEWTTETPYSGRRCIKTTVAADAEINWVAARRDGIPATGGANYTVTGWVKAHDVVGIAGMYVHVSSASNALMLNKVESAGNGTFDWRKVTVQFTAPDEAQTIRVGTVLRGTGTTWHDDFSVACDRKESATAHAGPVEEHILAEDGTPPRDVASAARVPVYLVNSTDATVTGALAHVDIARLLRGRSDEGRFLLHDGDTPVPHMVFRDKLVFDATVPARTRKAWYLSLPRPDAHVSAAGTAGNDVSLKLGSEIPSDYLVVARERGMSAKQFAVLLGSRANLVRNASFEEGTKLPDAWPGSAEGNMPEGSRLGVDTGGLFGKRCASVRVPHGARPAWVGWRQSVSIKPGHTYLYGCWLKCEDVRGTVMLHAHQRTAQGELCATNAYLGAGPRISATSDWQLCLGTVTIAADAAFLELHLTMDSTGALWHDGALVAEIANGEIGEMETGTDTAQASLAAWAVNPIVKVFQEDLPPAAERPWRISAARNEEEPLQIALRSTTDIADVAVTVQTPVNRLGKTLGNVDIAVVGYVPVDFPTNYYRSETPVWHRKFPTRNSGCDGWPGMWPDPLLPRTTFDLAKAKTQPVWLTVRIPHDAATGDYTGAVDLRSGDQTLVSRPFSVHVWDFALPDDTHVAAIYDLRISNRWQTEGQTREDADEQLQRFMAGKRVSPDQPQGQPVFRLVDGKVQADFTEYDRDAELYFDQLKFMRGYMPRFFYLFGWAHPPKRIMGEDPYDGDYPYEGADRAVLRPEYKQRYQQCLKLYWDHVKGKGWADRLLLYISDEPHFTHDEIRVQMKALCDMIHEVDREIPIYSSTWRHCPDWNGYIDVWGVGHYGCFPVELMRERVKAGDRFWFTTDGQMCTDTPYCAVERLLPHYCFQYDVEAYEFWGLTWLTYDPYEYGWHSYIPQSSGPGSSFFVRYPNGDGYLAYPGAAVGHHGPVTSIRLEQAREGIEDYEYLYLLRERLNEARGAGKDVAFAEAALADAAALVEIPNAGGRYSSRILPDPDAVFTLRQTVAEAIEKLK